MGCADVVPGVSGGTIAVVLGVYERLLRAVSGVASAAGVLLRGDWRACRQRLAAVEWSLLLPLLAGMSTTIVLLASVIEAQLEERPETMAGLFCGLVAASAVAAMRLFPWRSVEKCSVMAVSAAATFALLGLRTAPVVEPSVLMLAGAGAVAVCAMILPGVSGAFLLLMMGMYGAVLNIVSELRCLDALVFALGASAGLALFASWLQRMLERARGRVMSVLVGLMFGSLRVLWPWPDGVGVMSRHDDEIVSGTALAWPGTQEWPAPTAAAAVGFSAVAILTRLSRRRPVTAGCDDADDRRASDRGDCPP